MGFATGASSDLARIVAVHGIPFSMQLYSRTFNSYDEEILAASGTTITGSLVHFPLGKDEKQYLEQGLLKVTDRKVFLQSGIEFNETADLVFNAGSWNVVPNAQYGYQSEGVTVYNRLFVRSKQ